MGSQIADNAAAADAGRADGLRARNRRVGLVVMGVALLLALATVAYVTWLGGANIGPHASAGIIFRGDRA